MFPLIMLGARYVLGTISLISGIVMTPLPLPLGIPLILLAITLFAGSTKPARRIVSWLFARVKRGAKRTASMPATGTKDSAKSDSAGGA